MSAHLKHDDYIPLLKEVGAEWLVVSNAPVACFALLETAPGSGTSMSVELPEELADGAYVVIAQAEGKNDIHVDESTKTTTGFDLLAGSAFDSEVVNILVIGSRLATQPAPIVR